MSIEDDEQLYYICGRCRHKIYFLVTEDAPVPCTECGFEHKSRLVTDVPSETKIDLSEF